MARELSELDAERLAARAARRLRKADAYADLEIAVDAGSKTHMELALMDDAAVRAMIGEKAKGLSTAFVGNLRDRLVRKMQQAELQSAADWIVSRVSGQYPNAEVSISRGRVVQVHLDGVPEEAV